MSGVHMILFQATNLANLILFCSFLDGSIISFIFYCLGVITVTSVLTLVLFSGRAGKILDTTAKRVVILAGGSNLYKNQGGGSSSSDDSDKEKDNDKDQDKDKDKKVETETNDSNSDSNTAYKYSIFVVFMINQIKLNTNIKITQSFSLLGLIMSQLNLNVDETASKLTQLSYGVLLLSLIALICFINVVGFMITYIFLQKGNS